MDRDHVPAAILYITAGVALYVIGQVMARNLDPLSFEAAVGGFVTFTGQITLAVGVLVSASKYFR